MMKDAILLDSYTLISVKTLNTAATELKRSIGVAFYVSVYNFLPYFSRPITIVNQRISDRDGKKKCVIIVTT